MKKMKNMRIHSAKSWGIRSTPVFSQVSPQTLNEEINHGKRVVDGLGSASEDSPKGKNWTIEGTKTEQKKNICGRSDMSTKKACLSSIKLRSLYRTPITLY